MSQEHFDRRELSAFEQSLASLAPLATSRDELMFLAGRTAAERELAAAPSPLRCASWPLATAASLLVAASSVWWGMQQSAQDPVAAQINAEPVMVETAPGGNALAQDQSSTAASTSYDQSSRGPRLGWQNAQGEARAYLRLRDQWVARGYDSVGPASQEAQPADHRADTFSEIRARFLQSRPQAF